MDSSHNTFSAPSALPTTAASRLRKQLKDPSSPILVAPGVYDGLSARVALEVGFEALYMTGAGTSASLQGHADLGVLGMAEMRGHAEMIANLNPNVPLIADADTGYGGPIMVARTVHAYARAGVAALHLEDQVQTKRCGHLQGKELAELDVFLTRIRAATSAREAAGKDILIIARTDALQSFGWEEAIRRLRAAQDCGADMGFLEGVRTKEEAASAVKELDGFPLLLNMVYGGSTPAISVQEAEQLGYKLVIFPFAAISPAYYAIKSSMEVLRHSGELATNGRMAPRDMFEVVGLEESLKIDADAGGSAYSTGV